MHGIMRAGLKALGIGETAVASPKMIAARAEEARAKMPVQFEPEDDDEADANRIERELYGNPESK
jgi:hypothetical protein